jgi:hypothetical protein
MNEKEAQSTPHDSPILVGRAVRHIRDKLFLDAEGHRLTQRGLYDECTESEQWMRSTGRHPRKLAFAVVEIDEREKKISKIENAKSDGHLTFHKAEVLSRAFDLPPTFLRTQYASLNELEAAYRAVKTRRTFTGFRDVPAIEILPRAHQSVVDQLTRLIASRDAPSPRVVLVEGRSGIGKSSVMTQWFNSSGRNSFESALRVDGRADPIGSLVPELAKHFRLPEDAQLETVLDALPAERPFLIVLDKLRHEQFREGTRLRQESLPTLRDLARLIAGIGQARPNVSFILLFEINVSFSLCDTLQKDLLGLTIARIEVTALNDRDGAEFLAVLGASGLPEQRRRAISA